MKKVSAHTKTYIMAIAISAAACVCMVLFPSIAFLSAQKAISLWASNVLPALLPFFICANFMSAMGITRILRPPAFAFSMSVMSGYPMGGKIIGDLCRRRIISPHEAKGMVSFCSTSGPAFMVGAVGVGMLGSALCGGIIAVAHYLAAIVNGFLFSLFAKKPQNNTVRFFQPAENLRKEKDILDIFTESITSSFKALGIILSYIVLFMFVTDMLQFFGAFSFLDGSCAKAVAKGILEMTVGCSALAFAPEISLLWKCVLCTMMISFGGLSVIGQTMSMLAGTGVRFSYFLLVKLSHCILSGIIAFILASFIL